MTDDERREYFRSKLPREFSGYGELSHTQRETVLTDYLDALDVDGCTVEEYARRIGRGNILAYASTLRAK